MTDSEYLHWVSKFLSAAQAEEVRMIARRIADTAGAKPSDCQFKACVAPFVCGREGKCQMENMKAQGFVHVTSSPAIDAAGTSESAYQRGYLDGMAKARKENGR